MVGYEARHPGEKPGSAYEPKISDENAGDAHEKNPPNSDAEELLKAGDAKT